MDVAIVTGSAGLVGSEAVRLFSTKFDLVVGVDNEMRQAFFGVAGSVTENRHELELIPNYVHHKADIREYAEVSAILEQYGSDVKVIVHAAGQPSHDYATEATREDFGINAVGTLNVLEAARRNCFDAVFIYTSTNKVYGDVPNSLPLVELDTRWEIDPDHPFHEHGIDESMSVDQTNHTFFGSSKLAADILAQEFGRHLGMKVGVFRCGCLTGPRQAGVQMHGFLSYVVRCAVSGARYTIFGHEGKQVRDNLDARDLASMFWSFYQSPRAGAVYHAGGGRERSCSVLEAIHRCEELTGRKMEAKYSPRSRFSDAKVWISDTRKFQRDFPDWRPRYSLDETIVSIHDRWALPQGAAMRRVGS